MVRVRLRNSLFRRKFPKTRNRKKPIQRQHSLQINVLATPTRSPDVNLEPKKPMRTDKQTEASRTNGAKLQGPRRLREGRSPPKTATATISPAATLSCSQTSHPTNSKPSPPATSMPSQTAHLERIRLGTPSTQIVDRVAQRVSDPRLKGSTLVAHASGLGAPVVESRRPARVPLPAHPRSDNGRRR